MTSRPLSGLFVTTSRPKLILAGPYSGKTTAAKAGKAYDPELDKSLHFAEASEKYKQARNAGASLADLSKLDDIRRAAYDQDFDFVLQDKRDEGGEAVVAMVAHFGPGKYARALKAGWDVRIVVIPPDELRKRARIDKSDEKLKASRAAAAAEQLSTLIHWLQTDGKWHNVKLYTSIDAALNN